MGKRKNILFFLTVLCCITIPEIRAEATIYMDTSENWLCTNLEDGTIEIQPNEEKIVDILDSQGQLIIPETLDEKTVSKLADGFFQNCTKLIKVEIPDSVTTIGMNAFNGCTSLEEVVLSNNLETISVAAFSMCSALKSITIPDSVTSMGDIVFYKCTSLEEIVLSNNLKTIPEAAFGECTALKSIIIPENMSSIGSRAFYNCKSLESVVLSTSLEQIGSDAFSLSDSSGIAEVLTITIPEELEDISSLGLENISGMKTVIISVAEGSKAETYLQQFNDIVIEVYPAEHPNWTYDTMEDGTLRLIEYSPNIIELDGSIIIPGKLGDKIVTVLDASLFEGNTDIKKIVIRDGIRQIEDKCFYKCNNLTKIELPATLKAIGYDVFNECENLMNIDIPENVTAIGGRAFWYTLWLVYMRFKFSIYDDIEVVPHSNMEDGAYYPVVVNNLLLDGRMWDNQVDMVPENVNRICSYAFYAPGSYGATEPTPNDHIVNISFANPNTVLDPAAFYGCNKLERITLPANLKRIENNTFEECSSLKCIKIPDSVTYIGENAFLNCTSLEEIVLSSSLEEIDENAFAGAGNVDGDTSLTITIPEDLEDISDLGLENLTNITNITINVVEGSKAYIYLQQFNYITVNTYIQNQPTPDDDSRDKQDTPTNNSTETPTDNSTEAPTDDSVKKETPQKGNTYTVGNLRYKVTSAKDVTFMGASNRTTKKVTIPAKVTILDQSFKVSAVNKNALKGYTKLTTVVVGSNVKTIGAQAFMNCATLKKITIGKNVKTIGKQAFYGDKKLTRIIFKGAKVTKIGKKSLRSVPKKVKITAPKKAMNKYKKLLNAAK